MNIVLASLSLAGGLVILWKSADAMVSGAVALARRLGVSSLVIGLTVVAMGTSAPEVAASITAALRGAGDVAIGNVYGSNIANLALVGGICALIRPIVARKELLRRQIPVMLAVALLLWPVLHNLELARSEGVFLLAIFAALIYLTARTARRQSRLSTAKPLSKDENSQKHTDISGLKSAVLIFLGLAGLAIGADLTVRGAVSIGQRAGLGDAVIGLTIIAIGTSLPELVTCVVASIKGQNDISIGNLVGSNIFNTLLVVGVAGTVRPFAIGTRLIEADYWIMILAGFGFAAAAILGKGLVKRSAGAVLLLAYLVYMGYLLAFSK